MSVFVEVAKKDELEDGSMRKIVADGTELLLARVDGRYYCIQAKCPHLGGDLSKGVLNGTIIECPLHHSRFDLADGRVIHWAGGVLGKIRGPVPLKTHEVRADGDRIEVKP